MPETVYLTVSANHTPLPADPEETQSLGLSASDGFCLYNPETIFITFDEILSENK